MKRHPSLDRIIEVSIEEADKLFELAETALKNFGLRVVLVNAQCSMALCPSIKYGKPGYLMGKVSDAAIFGINEAEDIINRHNPNVIPALRVHAVSPFTGFSRAGERVNNGLEECIELHNKNNTPK